MLYLKFILITFAAIAIEGLVPQYWAPFSYVDLPLLVTVYFALMRDPLLGMVAGTVAGLGGDLAPGAGPLIGVGGFSKTIIGYLVASVAVRFSLEAALTRVAVIGAASIVNSFLYIGLHELMGQSVGGELAGADLILKVAFEGAANVIFGVLAFWLFDKFFPESAPGGQMRVRRRFYD